MRLIPSASPATFPYCPRRCEDGGVDALSEGVAAALTDARLFRIMEIVFA